MNQASRFCVCRSSLLRRNPFTSWSSSNSISSSLILNTNPTYSYLLTAKFHHHTFNHPPAQIPAGNHFRKFSGEAAEEFNFRDDYLENEIGEIEGEEIEALTSVARSDGPPLDAVKILADKFNGFMEKLGLHYDNEKRVWEDEEAEEDDYPPHLRRYSQKISIDDLEYRVDMVVAYGEYIAAGGSSDWHPFHGEWRDLMIRKNPEEYDRIIASLQKMKIRSKMMWKLLESHKKRQILNHQ